MNRLLLLHSLLFISIAGFSNTIIVKNIEELKKANNEARPGDTIVLQNGEWNNVIITLNCEGTKEKPIIVKAQTAGKVIITGNSMLKLGGSFIVVDGLLFTNGYSGDHATIDFRIDKDQLANNCRVTNCVVNDFNNPKRLQDNNWVSFSGKNNRLDHCSFMNKKNMGVLLAVVLDDERSRENFHSIDHNYFGVRIPLASNGGEIIRVGVSQHCQFNSNTQIVDNFFEHCDGETEIISVKSGSNVVRNNLFKECQGGVVLRHGDNNTVENNIFLGNDKEGTGGVRVINKGQWVINNLFYKCRGVDFRAPLSVMNGIPNSPAFRYVQVTDAVIANNTWYNCSPASFCEGSDTERILPPQNVYLLNNTFYNSRDSAVYKAYDDIGGFLFANNFISREQKQEVTNGFERAVLTVQKNDMIEVPAAQQGKTNMPDSLQQAAQQRLHHPLSFKSGFADLSLLKIIISNSYSCGAKWLDKNKIAATIKPILVNCKNAEEVYKQLSRKEPVAIHLSGKEYKLDKPFIISKNVDVTSNRLNEINFITESMQSAFIIAGNGKLSLRGININGSGVKAAAFISCDSTGSSDHYNLTVSDCSLSSFDRSNGCQDLFHAYKSMVADSIVINKTIFLNNSSNVIMIADEKDNKGYYNAEKIVMTLNKFSNHSGILLDLYRGGSDESTMGPKLIFTDNKLQDCKAGSNKSATMISLTGAQVTTIKGNQFIKCYDGGNLIEYKDFVRAAHVCKNNVLKQSGRILTNKYVKAEGNKIE